MKKRNPLYYSLVKRTGNTDNAIHELAILVREHLNDETAEDILAEANLDSFLTKDLTEIAYTALEEGLDRFSTLSEIEEFLRERVY
jgi:hypothetical protein